MALLHDDYQHWALADGGFQPVPNDDGSPFDEMVHMTSLVEPGQWKRTVREAIDAGIKASKEIAQDDAA